MTSRLIALLALFVLALGTDCPRAWAELSEDRQTLAGIRTVAVLVDSLAEPGSAQIALPGEIRNEVEQKLRQAGLRVVDMDDLAPAGGFPLVWVNIGLLGQTLGDGDKLQGFVYVARVELHQYVSLFRRRSVLASAPTWRSAGVYGYVGLLRTDLIRDGIRSQVDEFLNAYLAANPKAAGK